MSSCVPGAAASLLKNALLAAYAQRAVLMENGETQLMYVCVYDGCDKKFSMRSALHTHLVMPQPQPRPLPDSANSPAHIVHQAISVATVQADWP